MTNMPRRAQAARAERLSAFPLGSQQGCYVTDSSSGITINGGYSGGNSSRRST
jgi:hypothetical protein